MLLFKAAKLAGGLRLLIATSAPLVVSSAALLSVRTAAYLAGAALGSIGVTLWPIVVTLIGISGIFGEFSQECDDLWAEVRRYRLANEPFPGSVDWVDPGCTYTIGLHCSGVKKVWLQTIWASQSEFATQTKSCFLIGYS